ncbi:glycosyltransferase family 2 protein [Henriciella sp.]|uniref:glycosyltransferase family 2 protein n=1 Tax=Henriciella sp. TaxID=1968823 RepID=UPI00262DD3F2|nr:glycosyltransferase family 2 protein [Henriciella sp.]
MKLSVVTTLYRSVAELAEFHRRASEAAREFAGDDYEIVLVNDGSPDDSLSLAVDMVQNDPHLTVIDLSRNFGHHQAMMTGLAHASGDYIFLIDSDLEEDPAWLSPFADELKSTGSDVVFGVQRRRKGNLFERFTGSVFYRAFDLMSGVKQPHNIVTARLMTRRYVDGLLSHSERELNIGGLWLITGFKQTHHVVDKLALSPTSYSLSRKFDHFVNAITSFSNRPLFIVFYSGLAIFGTSVAFIVYLLFQYFFLSQPPAGYVSVVASIWLFSGLIILFNGILGVYIAKVFSEVKQRPLTVVRQIYRSPESS